MCAGRCAAYVSLSQFITPSGLRRIWQTANMVQKLIYFLKLIHPRHLFNDQQLSRQSFTVKSNQSGHNTRSFFNFFIISDQQKNKGNFDHEQWMSFYFTSRCGPSFCLSLTKKGAARPHTEQLSGEYFENPSQRHDH